MVSTYTTKQGDAWDAIAFHVYGDVKYTGFLMQANFPHLEDDNLANVPIWRTTT